MAFTNAGIIVARSVIAGSIDIPLPGKTGFHVDSSGNLGIGGTSATNGPFTVTSAGIVTAAQLNAGTISVGSLTWGGGSSLIASGAIDLVNRPAFNTPSAIQNVSATGFFALTLFTFNGPSGWATPPVAGDLLIAIFAFDAITNSAAGWTVNTAPAGWTAFPQGLTHIFESVQSPKRDDAMVCYWKIAAGGDAVPSIIMNNPNALGTNAWATIMEYTNIAAVPVDANASNSGTFTNAGVKTLDGGTTGATTQAIELALAIFGGAGVGSMSNITGGFSQRVGGSGSQPSVTVLERVTSATGAQHATGQITLGVGGLINYVAQTLTFKASGLPAPAAGHSVLSGIAHGTTSSVAMTDPGSNTTNDIIVPMTTSITAPITITGTETVVTSLLIPANFLQVGTMFHLVAYGVASTAAAAGTCTFRIRFGPTVLTANIAGSLLRTFANSQTTIGFVFRGELTVRSITAAGTMIANAEADSATLFTNILQISPTVTTVVLDSTVNNTIGITFQTSGVAGDTATFHQARVQMVKW